MKLLVMGYSGAGKSTLARALGEQYGCPVLHLDTVQFRENWQERDAQEAEALVEAFLNGNPGWVIDGNYLGRFSFERRCREADRIIQLLLPRHLCLYRVIKRYVQNRGTVRESMAAGCEERLTGNLSAGSCGRGERHPTVRVTGPFKWLTRERYWSALHPGRQDRFPA